MARVFFIDYLCPPRPTTTNKKRAVEEVEKRYYSISEVATQLKVSQSLLRHWETEFDFIKPKKNKKGDRQFTRHDIALLQRVYELVKEKGYTLQGARDSIKAKEYPTSEKAEVIASLQKLRTFLTGLRNGLDGQ